MELRTVKEYCKRENITDAGARKRVSSKLVKSVILDEMLYIVEENDEKKEIIKTLKNRLRNATDRIKLLTAEKQTIIDQREYIKKLEEKNSELEAKLFKEIDEQKILMRDVITHQNRMLQPPQQLNL